MSSDFSSLPIDDLLQQLKDTPNNFQVKAQDSDNTQLLPPVSSKPVTEDELGEYIIKQTTNLIDHTMGAFKNIKDVATATNDPETITALADLIKAANGALDSLNKINIQNKKSKTAKEVATINVEARKKELENQKPQTNIFMQGATREEILKIIEQTKQKSSVIDAEFVEQKSPKNNTSVISVSSSIT